MFWQFSRQATYFRQPMAGKFLLHLILQPTAAKL
jgi:hypothetical protein